MSVDLSKPLVLLTGASGLLAQEFIVRYHSHWHIVAISRKPAEVESESESESEANSETETKTKYKSETHSELCTYLQADISDPKVIISSVLEQFGAIHAVINNAVYYSFQSLAEADPHDVLQQFQVNTVAPLALAQECLKQYWSKQSLSENQQRPHSILNISSISAVNHYLGARQGAYAASKAALNILTKHMAADFALFGVRVNAIAPNSFPQLISTASVCDLMQSCLQSNNNGDIIVMEQGGNRVL